MYNFVPKILVAYNKYQMIKHFLALIVHRVNFTQDILKCAGTKIVRSLQTAFINFG